MSDLAWMKVLSARKVTMDDVAFEADVPAR